MRVLGDCSGASVPTTPRPGARRGGRRWLGLGQTQAQLAAARLRQYPRPPMSETGHSPLCSAPHGRSVKTYVASVHFKCSRGILQAFSHRCCKSRSSCYICCNGCTRILQASIINVSSFSDVCCKCIYLNVAYVFTHMLQVFYLDVVYVLQ
jgi:hypothetical protein